MFKGGDVHAVLEYYGGCAMSEDFGADFISISDDEGKNYELEHLDTIDLDGVFYLAFLPADIDENDERFGVVILKSEINEDGDEYLVNPSDEETEIAYERFMERLFGDEEDETEDE